jgi:hypothetical protein
MTKKKKERQRRTSWSPPEKKQILADYKKFPTGRDSITWKGKQLFRDTWKKWNDAPSGMMLHQVPTNDSYRAASLFNMDPVNVQIEKIKHHLSRSTPKKIRRLINAVQPVLSPVFTGPKIRQGFIESGVWPYDPDRILFKVKGVDTFPKPLFDKIKSAIEHLNSIFESEKVEEKVMDEYDIPKSDKQQVQEGRDDLKQRDDLITSRQRAVILTHAHFFAKRETQRKEKEAKEKKKEEKAAEKKAKRIDREKKKEAKAKDKEVKKLAREHKRRDTEAKKKAQAEQKEKKKKEKKNTRRKSPKNSKQPQKKKRKQQKSDEDDDFDVATQVVDDQLSNAKVKSMIGFSKADLLASILE